MAIKLSKGEYGSDVFSVGSRVYPVGKFFLYRKGESVLVNSNEMGTVAAYGHYSDFEDAQGESFASVDDLVDYLNELIFGKRGSNVNTSGMNYEFSEGSVIIYDRRRVYGSQTNPLSGAISDYHDGAIDSSRGEGLIFHKDENEPTLPSGFVKGSGEYMAGQLNLIRYQYFTQKFKVYSISNLGEGDLVDIYDGLVLHYDFNVDIGSGNFIPDKSGYNNDGVLTYKDDAIWLTDGGVRRIQVGNSSDKDQRSYIRIPFSKSLSLVKHQFSILVDFGKFSQFTSVIFGSYTLSSGNNGINIGTVSDGRLELELNEESIGSAGRGRSSAPDGAYTDDGSTKRFLVTYDGRIIRFYVNGALNRSNEVEEGVYVYNEEDWYLGKVNGGTVSFQTVFRRFAVWQRVLSDEEIAQVWEDFQTVGDTAPDC